MPHEWQMFRHDKRRTELSDEVPSAPDLLQALAELVVDDQPIVIHRDGSPQLVVIDWFEFDLLIDSLDEHQPSYGGDEGGRDVSP